MIEASVMKGLSFTNIESSIKCVRKTNISCLLIRKLTCTYQWVRNVRPFKHFLVSNKWMTPIIDFYELAR